MSASIKKVALAGATGALGKPMLQALLDAHFKVTVLTRSTSSNTDSLQDVQVAKVDYEDDSSLKSALQGQDTVISTLGTAAAAHQKKLVDAAISAGVKRFIPSEFGCDLGNPAARPLPVYAQKVEIEKYLQTKCEGTGMSYTFIFNNAFMDWGLRAFIMNIKEKKITLFDGGDVTFTATPLSFIAKGTAAVLQHPKETANRAVRLHGAAVTQRQMLGYAQAAKGEDSWQVSEASTTELEKKAYENLKSDPGNVMGWVLGFLFRAAFSADCGADFSRNNDNALLGLKEMSEKEVEEVVRNAAQSA